MENTNVVVNEEVVTMELLAKGTEYRDIAAKAKELGLNYVGVKKDALLDQVNEMIAKINNGEATLPEIEVPTAEDQDESGEIETNEDGTTTAPRAKRERTQAAPRVKAKKWFEEEGAFTFAEGDIVQIESGKDLIGRKVEVVQPSAKKNAFKGYLLHPVTGERQKTFLSVDFDRVVLVQKAGQTAEVEAPAETEVTEEQQAI